TQPASRANRFGHLLQIRTVLYEWGRDQGGPTQLKPVVSEKLQRQVPRSASIHRNLHCFHASADADVDAVAGAGATDDA
ncbi:unnamed protein product, partial [Cercopithifilaria johnstoni]